MGDLHCRFGRAVQVAQARFRHALEEQLDRIAGQRLARTHHALNAGALLQARLVEEDAQHRRHEVQQADALLADQLDQVGAVAVPVGPRDDDRRAGHQRPEELAQRHVEAVGCLQQHAVVRRQVVLGLHPLQPVHDAAVRVHRALRAAGRAGGEDHVGRVVGRAGKCEGRCVVAARGAGHVAGGVTSSGGIDIDEPQGLGQRRAHAAQLGLAAQHERHAGVLAHARDALGRVRRVQRHIRRAAVDDAHQRRDKLDATLQAHADERARPGAGRAQPQRQRAGCGVELGIAQRALLENHRTGLRRHAHLSADQVAQPQAAFETHLGRVPALQLGAFRVAHQFAAGDSERGVGEHAVEHRQVAGQHALRARFVEQVGGVLELGLAEGLGVHRQRQVELRCTLVEREGLGRQPVEAVDAVGRVQHVEHHLHQRREVAVAARREFLHQGVERHVLVRVGLQRGVLDAREQLGERELGVDAVAHHQRVDERADERLGFELVPVRHRHADRDVGLPAVACQHQVEGGQQGHEGRDAVRQAEARELGEPLGAELGVHRAAGTADRAPARLVGRQRERLHAIELSVPPSGLRRQRGVVAVVALPFGVVGELDGRRRERGCLATHQRGVDLLDFVKQHASGPLVGDRVVHQPDEHMVGLAQLQQAGAVQPGVRQVEAACADGTQHAPCLAFALHGRKVAQVHTLQRHGRVGADELGRFAVDRDEARAEGLVPAGHHVQAVRQLRRVERAAQSQREGHVVGRGLWVELLHQPHAALRVRGAQWRVARHAVDAARRGGGLGRGRVGGARGAGQEFGGAFGGALCGVVGGVFGGVGGVIGGSFVVAVPLRPRHQFAQRGAVEQHRERQRQTPVRADARHQPGCVQRVPAEREEVVVAAHRRQMQHLAPQASQRGLARGRCRIGSRAGFEMPIGVWVQRGGLQAAGVGTGEPTSRDRHPRNVKADIRGTRHVRRPIEREQYYDFGIEVIARP